MKNLLFIIFVLASLKMLGQKNNFYIGVNASPDISYRLLTNNLGIPLYDEMIRSYNNSDAPTIAGTTGIDCQYFFNNQLSIESGIQYSNKSFRSSLFTNKYHFIDIPVKIGYMAGKNKIRFSSSLGVAANFMLSPKAIGNEGYNLSSQISVGVAFLPNEKSLIRVEPIFRYAGLKSDSPITIHFYSFGLNLSYFKMI